MGKPGPLNLITDVAGLRVGHAIDLRIRTGVTVILPEHRAACSVDVRGGGSGTRETDLLRPEASMPGVVNWKITVPRNDLKPWEPDSLPTLRHWIKALVEFAFWMRSACANASCRSATKWPAPWSNCSRFLVDNEDVGIENLGRMLDDLGPDFQGLLDIHRQVRPAQA